MTKQIQPLVDDAIRLCEEIVDDLHKNPVNYNLTGTVLLLNKLTNISRELDKKLGKPPLTVTLNPENSKPCAMSQYKDIEAKHFTGER